MNSKKIIFLVLIIWCNSFSTEANEIKIIAKVGNEIITSLELENKIKSTLFLSGQKLSQENINNVKNQSLQSLINNKLKKEEVKKYNLKLDDEKRIDNYLKDVALKLNVNKNQLKEIFLLNQINYDQFLDEIKNEHLWRNLIYQLYNKNIDLNENQIINELNKTIQVTGLIEEYHLAEIELNSTDNAEISKVNNYINEFGFKKAATKFSISNSGIKGGDIGWVNSKALSRKINDIIKKLKIGSFSKPIQTTDSTLILKLINKRNFSNTNEINVEKLKNTIINKQTNELLNMYASNHLSQKKNSTLIEIR